MNISDEVIRCADLWLDGAVSDMYKDQPLAQDWARTAKVAEEVGEAIAALIGWSGQNPRKGVTHELKELLGELADCMVTGVLAIQHFTKDSESTLEIVQASFDKLAGRIPVEYIS